VASGAYSEAQLDFDHHAIGRAPEIRPPGPDEARLRRTSSRRRPRLTLEVLTLVILAGVAAAWIALSYVIPLVRSGPDTHTVVDRIIRVESNGNSNAKNIRSSAAGTGQILNQTWLEMIRKHRLDLIQGRSESDLLALRSDPVLVREIVVRMVEGNAAMLKKRGLPVTAGTLYLAHFAGSSGAVALLTNSDDLDAASLLASADASGRITREKLVKANPFLATFTVGDLKSWADRKMRG
jgi:hypothetical protein